MTEAAVKYIRCRSRCMRLLPADAFVPSQQARRYPICRECRAKQVAATATRGIVPAVGGRRK